MPKRVELLPKAEIGRAYALVDENRVEIHVAGVMGALKAWLVGGENVPIGNIVGGRLVREVDTRPHRGILITQSGRQMFYGGWSDEENEPPVGESAEEKREEKEPPTEKTDAYAPLPDFAWEKITGKSFPSTDERVRYALSTRAFFDAFRKNGYYLFGRDGEKFALAVKRTEGENPFPNHAGAAAAGDYVYLVL